MQETSALYQQLYMSGKYKVETALVIGESGRLITEQGYVLTFGGDAILISSSGADGGYNESMLLSLKTTRRVFADGVPQVGCCTCGEIYVEMLMPLGEIPPMAMLVPYVRLVSTEDERIYSEWLKKGVFYIDSRSNTRNRDDLDILRLHGYDAMMKANKDYSHPGIGFPNTDLNVVRDIANIMGVQVDTDTIPLLNKGYRVQYPANYTMRETLQYIGAMYAGNWIINDFGALQLICLNGLPPETSLLTDELGYRLLFADDTRILV